MIDSYFIIDDCIPNSYQDEIEELFYGNNSFPWYYVNDVTLTQDRLDTANTKPITPAFNHVFFSNHGTDPFYPFIKPLAYMACEKIDFSVQSIIQARAFLQMPNGTELRNNHPHIDLPYDHLVCLYYVNDNEAVTTLYKQTRHDTDMKDLARTDFEPLVKCTPKKGRCLFFNGKHYHSSSSPRDGARSIINFDLV
jgi:hypothetical protein